MAVTIDRADIQGNILAGFNKDHMTFLFFSIQEANTVRQYWSEHADEIATTDEVEAFNRAYKTIRKHRPAHIEEPMKPIAAIWMNVAFTAAGLQKVGSGGANFDIGLSDEVFRANIQSRAGQLGHTGESDPSQWEPGFQNADGVDGVLTIAADRHVDRNNAVENYTAELSSNGAAVVAVWNGDVRADQPGHEHFGFKDGVSQPSVTGYNKDPDAHAVSASEFVLGLDEDEAPSAPSPSPYGETPAPVPTPTWLKNASYLVIQKLSQNVPGFNLGVQQLAGELSVSPDLAGAKLVGRQKDGCPLAIGDEAHQNADQDAHKHSQSANEFGYADDANGDRTPRAAHIRKAWPRDQDSPGSAEADKSRILRRGIPYGPSITVPTESSYGDVVTPDPTDRGLLFACYQTSIVEQFERIQGTWAANSGFPQAGDGVDTILNELQGQAISIPPHGTHPVQPWVRMHGGGYFIALGVAGLRALVNSTTP